MTTADIAACIEAVSEDCVRDGFAIASPLWLSRLAEAMLEMCDEAAGLALSRAHFDLEERRRGIYL